MLYCFLRIKQETLLATTNGNDSKNMVALPSSLGNVHLRTFKSIGLSPPFILLAKCCSIQQL